MNKLSNKDRLRRIQTKLGPERYEDLLTVCNDIRRDLRKLQKDSRQPIVASPFLLKYRSRIKDIAEHLKPALEALSYVTYMTAPDGVIWMIERLLGLIEGNEKLTAYVDNATKEKISRQKEQKRYRKEVRELTMANEQRAINEIIVNETLKELKTIKETYGRNKKAK
jgi:hypothetical protein